MLRPQSPGPHDKLGKPLRTSTRDKSPKPGARDGTNDTTSTSPGLFARAFAPGRRRDAADADAASSRRSPRSAMENVVGTTTDETQLSRNSGSRLDNDQSSLPATNVRAAKPHMEVTAAEVAASSPLTGGRFSVRLLGALPAPHEGCILELRVEHVGGAKEPPQQLGPQHPEFAFFSGCETSVLEVAVKNKRQVVGSFPMELWRLPLQRDVKLTKRVVSHQSQDGAVDVTLELCAFNFGEEDGAPLETETADEHTRAANGEFSSAVVDVEILEARDLPAMDSNGTSDPYCICSHGDRSYRTPVMFKTLNCKFVGQDCTFYLNDADPTLRVMLWDRDRRSRDDFLGGVIVNLSSDIRRLKSSLRMLQRGRWYELTRESKHKFGFQKHSGWVRLRIQVNMEFQEDSMLSHLGSAMRTLPFRVNVGDMILFDCSSATGKLISAMTHNKWDHVGVIVTVGKNGHLFLMEATTVGTYAYPFEERIRGILNTGASMALRRLVDVERSQFMLHTIADFVAEHEGKPYDKSFGTLARSALKRNNAEDLSKFFCSELVAALYRKLGVLHDGSLANNYLPKDFTGDVIPGVVRGRFERRKKYSKRDYMVDREATAALPRSSDVAPDGTVSTSEVDMLMGAMSSAASDELAVSSAPLSFSPVAPSPIVLPGDSPRATRKDSFGPGVIGLDVDPAMCAVAKDRSGRSLALQRSHAVVAPELQKINSRKLQQSLPDILDTDSDGGDNGQGIE